LLPGISANGTSRVPLAASMTRGTKTMVAATNVAANARFALRRRIALRRALRRTVVSSCPTSGLTGCDALVRASLTRSSRGMLFYRLTQGLGQVFPTTMQMHASRRFGTAQDVRDLGRGAVLEIEEDDSGTLIRRELLDRTQHVR